MKKLLSCTDPKIRYEIHPYTEKLTLSASSADGQTRRQRHPDPSFNRESDQILFNNPDLNIGNDRLQTGAAP